MRGHLVAIVSTLTCVCCYLICTPNYALAQETSESQEVLQFGKSDEAAVFTQKSAEELKEEELRALKTPSENGIPALFDPTLNGVALTKQAIDYDLTDPKVLKVGPFELAGNSVGIGISRERAEFLDVEFGMDVSRKRFSMYLISFTWPEEFLRKGVLELIDDQNKVIWQRRIDDKLLNEWKKVLDQKKPLVIKTAADGPQATITLDPQKTRGPHAFSHFGLADYEFFEIPIWRIRMPFRFCLTQDSADGRLAACSKRYTFIRSGGAYALESASKTVAPKVLINDKVVPLKGSAIFLDEKTPIKFAALLGNGTYFEFVSSPQPVHVVDLALDDESGFVEVIGYGNRPMGDVQIYNMREGDFWQFLNFSPTIGDLREYWKARYPAQEPYLFLRGYGGAAFKQSFLYDQLPLKRMRPYIDKKAPATTYSPSVLLSGEIAGGVSVASEQYSAKKTSDTQFEWDFQTSQKGAMNRSIISVEEKGQSFKAIYEIYKGYPGEFSLRTTGVLTNELELVIMGEVAGQYWFDSIFGWSSRNLSQQRWGVAAKYFQTVASYGGKDEDDTLIKLQVINGDLKYRLTPGIWGRDPTLGLSLNAQSVTIENFGAEMAGAGIFWARSMPAFFDRVFNIIPFFRYPKWVDMEWIYYPLPISDKTELGVNVAFNFHGKIQWSSNFYGEAGFGLKSFIIKDLEVRKQIGLGMAYGTFGLGYSF